MVVRVVAPARLHLGFASTGRILSPWAGIGLALEEPKTMVEAELVERSGVYARGFRSEEAEEVARLIVGSLSPGVGVALRVLEAPPRHVGLGATTQLALAVLESVSRLLGVEPRLELLVEAGLAGGFSWVGVAAYKSGGFILDLGASPSKRRQYISLRFPESWTVVLARPPGKHGHPRRGEAEKLTGLTYSPEIEQGLIKLLGKQILPGLLDRDLELFGRGLAAYQRLVGSAFGELQRGVFNPDSERLVSVLEAEGLLGVGQSSWGPTVYGFSENFRRAEEVSKTLVEAHGCISLVTMANNVGARVEENPA